MSFISKFLSDLSENINKNQFTVCTKRTVSIISVLICYIEKKYPLIICLTVVKLPKIFNFFAKVRFKNNLWLTYNEERGTGNGERGIFKTGNL